MNILLLSYIMNACCVRLRYRKMHTHTHTHTHIYIYVGSRFSGRAHYNEFCKEWVQKLGSDGATACFGEEKYTESDGPTSQGEKIPRLRMWTPNSSPILGASLLSLWDFFPPPSLWDLCCYISFFSIHPPPTLVSHLCPYLSACPIDYSLWRSVSCCGPHCTV